MNVNRAVLEIRSFGLNTVRVIQLGSDTNSGEDSRSRDRYLETVAD